MDNRPARAERLRETALREAVYVRTDFDNTEAILERAEAFYRFLRGQE